MPRSKKLKPFKQKKREKKEEEKKEIKKQFCFTQSPRTSKTRFPITILFSLVSTRTQLKTEKSISELRHKELGRGWIKKV